MIAQSTVRSQCSKLTQIGVLLCPVSLQSENTQLFVHLRFPLCWFILFPLLYRTERLERVREVLSEEICKLEQDDTVLKNMEKDLAVCNSVLVSLSLYINVFLIHTPSYSEACRWRMWKVISSKSEYAIIEYSGEWDLCKLNMIYSSRWFDLIKVLFLSPTDALEKAERGVPCLQRAENQEVKFRPVCVCVCVCALKEPCC